MAARLRQSRSPLKSGALWLRSGCQTSPTNRPARDAGWRQAPFLLEAAAGRTEKGHGRVMNEIKSADIYRVCAVSNDRWDVYQDARSRPVASFNDKAAALNYAMCLARGRVAWHLLLKAGDEPSERMGVPAANETAAAPASH